MRQTRLILALVTAAICVPGWSLAAQPIPGQVATTAPQWELHLSASPSLYVFDSGRMPLASGFGIDSIDIANVTPQDTYDNDNTQAVLSAALSVNNLGGGQVEIDYQLHSRYDKAGIVISGNSQCSGGYEITVHVVGPRGVAPLTQ